MKRRNPLLTGLLNMLIPGSSHLYVSKNWRKFILFLIVYSFMIFFCDHDRQQHPEYTGIYTASRTVYWVLLLGMYAFLFLNGMKEASIRDSEIDSAAHYQSMRTNTSKGDPIAKLAKLQRQRDEGLISSEQQDVKKAEIESKEE